MLIFNTSFKYRGHSLRRGKNHKCPRRILHGSKGKHIAHSCGWTFAVLPRLAAYFPDNRPVGGLLYLVDHFQSGIRRISDPNRSLVLHQRHIGFCSNPVQMSDSTRNTAAVQCHGIAGHSRYSWLMHAIQVYSCSHIGSGAGPNRIAFRRGYLLAVPLPDQFRAQLGGAHGRTGLKPHTAFFVQRRQVQTDGMNQGVIKQLSEPLTS